MSKPKITRTYGPIHFEDLEPHRFEDLIRELIYDYKEWQSIEATGRSGSDEGFDIRAYEKLEIARRESIDEDDIEEVLPMEGNLWMIQGKREKEMGPKELKTILSDVSSTNPPYGYILAASVNFSKKSYDVFREELRKKGVMEFYLWGKPELEDMLHLPKNDRILFTFFGISLVSKRRTRTTEIRSAVNIKNKLFKITGESYKFYQEFLVRDLNDINYPYKDKYTDFNNNPRWKVYTAFNHHPLGLMCHTHEYYCYVDMHKKVWDFTEEVDLVFSQEAENDERQEIFEKKMLIHDFWEFLPRKNQAHYIIDSLIKYADIAILDDKGDFHYKFPHIFVNFDYKLGPFNKSGQFFKSKSWEVGLSEEFTRINIFPKKFRKEKFGKIYKNKHITLNGDSRKEFKEHNIDTIYETDGKYAFLNSRDVIKIEDSENENVFIQITYKYKTKVKTYIEGSSDNYQAKRQLEQQLGRIPKDSESIYIYECKRVYSSEFEKS